MPACSTAVHPSGASITFEEASHKYSSTINGKDIAYTSGTTFVHGFVPQFDPDGSILRNKALKEGISPEELQAKWNKKRDDSCAYGTRVHETCEDTLLGHEYRNTPENEKEEAVFGHAKQIAAKFRDSLDILAVEKIVFSPYLPKPIAGTIDLLARSRKDGSILILDWKTNEKIDTFNKFGSYCLDPIADIPNLNYWHYSLQLSLYQYLLKFGKYVPADSKFKRAIIHLTEGGYKIIQLPDLTDRIKDMIIWKACDFNPRPDLDFMP